jgi:hypothetical protein
MRADLAEGGPSGRAEASPASRLAAESAAHETARPDPFLFQLFNRSEGDLAAMLYDAQHAAALQALVGDRNMSARAVCSASRAEMLMRPSSWFDLVTDIAPVIAFGGLAIGLGLLLFL